MGTGHPTTARTALKACIATGHRPDFAHIFVESGSADFDRARSKPYCPILSPIDRKELVEMKTAGLRQVSSFSLAGMIAAFGLAVVLAWAVSFTPVPAAAQGTPEQRQACQPDAMRLCSEFVPDVDRITACMVKNRIRLSAPCRAVFSTPSHKGRSFRHAS
jgi:hypothetical protein